MDSGLILQGVMSMTSISGNASLISPKAHLRVLLWYYQFLMQMSRTLTVKEYVQSLVDVTRRRDQEGEMRKFERCGLSSDRKSGTECVRMSL
ncbi:uncharacterized protein ARMOST_16780 [Armillaria ostoyae]|uniref:Uncharacterized protein n=1 Tax=Armillaria ostoyae TaxID=47428 RepID=A0A284RX88_ARMOS|nr:uncharacterized protein ARMOST_16780 [Armillaria ostoyae]